MNKAIITGRLTKDPVLEHTKNGTPICQFNIATNRPVTRDGEKVADFISCRVWNKSAENLVKYQTKGNLIAVIGRMQVDIYKDKDGNTRYSNYLLVEELEYLERKKDNNQEEKDNNQEEKEYQELHTTTKVQDQFDYDSSDLPF